MVSSFHLSKQANYVTHESTSSIFIWLCLVLRTYIDKLSLRKFMKKGPKQKEPRIFDFTKAFDNI